VLAVNPVRLWVKIPVVVPPSAKELPVGLAAVPHTVPREVSAPPPLAVTLAPSVALVVLMLVTVGDVTEGTTGTEREKLSTPWLESDPDSSVSEKRIYKKELLGQLTVWDETDFVAILKRGVIAAWVPGAPVPVLGDVKLRSVEKVFQTPAESLKVPSAVDPVVVTTSVLEIL